MLLTSHRWGQHRKSLAQCQPCTIWPLVPMRSRTLALPGDVSSSPDLPIVVFIPAVTFRYHRQPCQLHSQLTFIAGRYSTPQLAAHPPSRMLCMMLPKQGNSASLESQTPPGQAYALPMIASHTWYVSTVRTVLLAHLQLVQG